ncbi:hypothetical protein [Rufibacter sp. LB8]|uniref:hypothetical protein n=1 Tax=Rufibacter sp. LB8 TaxID=2777781 RepID=UPI00178C2D69|nr:hypothetical protein [Rufibacter sp. LB8]
MTSFSPRGKFLLYCDIKPLNNAPAVIRRTVEVEGVEKSAQLFQNEVLVSNVGDVSVYLEESALGLSKYILLRMVLWYR